MRVAIVIPCYNVNDHILAVLDRIGPEISHIYLVDDCCPNKPGEFVEARNSDSRVEIIRHTNNKGVGGAVMTGYQKALEDGVDIVIKLDGDNQMDPGLIPALIRPIQSLDADYVKGNRFYSLYDASPMPLTRLFGNIVLSFLTKLSSGYWRIFDPTNGFTAIGRPALQRLNFKNISNRYFFETDMLINLGGIRAVVQDFPMKAVYGDEESGLKINRVIFEFLFKHSRATIRRLLYMYFLRDFTIGSACLLLAALLGPFGILFGLHAWYISNVTGIPTTAGTVMIAVLPIFISLQLLLTFLSNDISNEPDTPLIKNRYDQSGKPLPGLDL